MNDFPFIKTDPTDDTLHFGKRGMTCAHCGAPYIQKDMQMPRTGRKYTAHYPSDTCCRERALEVTSANTMWASRDENLARETTGYSAAAYQEEGASLRASTRNIAFTMRQKREGAQ